MFTSHADWRCTSIEPPEGQPCGPLLLIWRFVQPIHGCTAGRGRLPDWGFDSSALTSYNGLAFPRPHFEGSRHSLFRSAPNLMTAIERLRLHCLWSAARNNIAHGLHFPDYQLVALIMDTCVGQRWPHRLRKNSNTLSDCKLLIAVFQAVPSRDSRAAPAAVSSACNLSRLHCRTAPCRASS